MRRRIAKKGRFKGKPFWGCSRYPACKGIERDPPPSQIGTIPSPRSRSFTADVWLGIGVFVVIGCGLWAWLMGVPAFISRPGNIVRPAGETIVGRASVVDGDTIEIQGQRIRFNGIDAPESDQTCLKADAASYRCGAAAAEFLDRFLRVSRPTTCDFVEWDQYGRFVGDCRRADGQEVAIALVRSGNALDWPRYSGGRYSAFQEEAAAKGLGLWQGAFEPPWDFRASRANKDADSENLSLTGHSAGNGPLQDEPASDCNIKGNISPSTGERIYHLPGQEYYDQTRITPSKGERWFCSEEEARRAGWRKSRI